MDERKLCKIEKKLGEINMRKTNKNYISDIDIMLREHKLTKKLTESEKQEIIKNNKIAMLRDSDNKTTNK